MRTDDQVVERIIEHLVGVRTGSRIGTGHDVTFQKSAANIELERVIAVLTRVLQKEIAAGWANGIEDEAMNSVALHEFGFEKKLCGKSSFQGDAPVEKARREQHASIDCECS